MSDDLTLNQKPQSTFLSFVNSLTATPVVNEGCKLCKSPHREEAEYKAEIGTKHTAIHRWLTEEKKEDISYGAVRNHLNHHLGEKKDYNNLKEFAYQLSKWSSLTKNDEILLSEYIDIFDREARLLLAENKEVSLTERRKNIEIASKVGQFIVSLKEQLRKIQNEKTPVELVIMSLNKIIEIKLKSNNCSQEMRATLTEILTQFKNEVLSIVEEHSQEEKNG